MFEQEAAAIRTALGAVAARVEHVGSTAVSGLAAKPTIDIQLSVERIVPRQRFVAALETLGYTFVADPTDPDHEYFKNEIDGVRTHQIHVCPVGSAWERRHLAFRNHLRTHPEDAARYAELKRRHAERYPNDIMAYAEAKTPFIRDLEGRAQNALEQAER